MFSDFADEVLVGIALTAGLLFAVTHVRVSRRRAADPRADDDRKTARLSMLGLLLESLAFAVLFLWPGGGRIEPAVWHWLAVALGVLALWIISQAVRHLGQNWRIQAVVTPRHTLVTTGPYAYVRHPIYFTVLLFLVAFGLAFSSWAPLMVALIINAAGTQLRIRSEDALLAQRFGPEFEAYRRDVKAYIPFLW